MCALQAQLSDILNMNAAETPVASVQLGREDIAVLSSGPELFRSCRVLDSKAASRKDWAFEFKNMAAAVVSLSRDMLDWAALTSTWPTSTSGW